MCGKGEAVVSGQWPVVSNEEIGREFAQGRGELLNGHLRALKHLGEWLTEAGREIV